VCLCVFVCVCVCVCLLEIRTDREKERKIAREVNGEREREKVSKWIQISEKRDDERERKGKKEGGIRRVRESEGERDGES
jgi:hypothetical protein